MNLEKHIENLQKFGVPVVVTLNSFVTDTEASMRLSAISVRSAAVSSPFLRYGQKAERAEKLLPRRFWIPLQIRRAITMPCTRMR